MSVLPYGESCSNVGRVHVLNDPPVWSFVSLAATRGVALPACYPALWKGLTDMFCHVILHIVCRRSFLEQNGIA
jgi:hypothetical protein